MKGQQITQNNIVGKGRSKFRGLISLVLCAALIITAFSGISFAKPKLAKAGENMLSNPIIVPDSSMRAGQKVTWDCIWFGSYPQAEVFPPGEEYMELSDINFKEDDLICDGELYQMLQSATDWDEYGDILINGEKYRRIKKEDAYSAVSADSEHYYWYYQWRNETGYHYFKYQPIKWRVLSVNGNELLLLSDKVLDKKQYHTEYEPVTWEGSTIRSWLNGYSSSENIQNHDYSSKNFIDTAFRTAEQQAIKETAVENEDNSQYGTDGGNNTQDKVFFLSQSEVSTNTNGYGFVSDEWNDEARVAESSVYAKAMGIFSSQNPEGSCGWWLRTPWKDSYYMLGITYGGWFGCSIVNDVVQEETDFGVRPVLNLDLAALPDTLWSYARTVCSDGTVEDEISALVGEYIEEHASFAQKDNVGHNFGEYCDLSDMTLRDYGELENEYGLWYDDRKKLLDSPYETVIADMVINETVVNNQVKKFNINLYFAQKSIVNDVMEQIERGSHTKHCRSRMKNILMTRDFSDMWTYNIWQDLLDEIYKLNKDKLQSLFKAYDKDNKFIELLSDKTDIVSSVIDVINYCSILQAYNTTSDVFKTVLTQMCSYCQDEDSALDYAVKQYLDVESQYDIRDAIINKVADSKIEVGEDLFKDALTEKVSIYLRENIDLSETGSDVASEILSFIERIESGCNIGVTIDNILFGTDNVPGSYISAYASTKAASCLRPVLHDSSSNLINEYSLNNAELFCDAFGMYKWIQEDVANKIIQYFSANQLPMLEKIFKSGGYETDLCRWQMMKLNWGNINCHDEIFSSSKMKCITIACPVDVTIIDTNGNLVLKILNDIVSYCIKDVEVCIRNAIKYIIVPDADYDIEITARDEGVMTYIIGSYDNMELAKTVIYEDIKMTEGTIYNGEIIEGESFTESDCVLVSNGDIVGCNSAIFIGEDRISVDDILLYQEQLTMEIGDKYKLQVDIIPSNASVRTLTWYSTDMDIATIDEYGVVTAKAVGETSIICMTLDGKCTQTCKLNVGKTEETSPDATPTPTAGPIETPDATQAPTAEPDATPLPATTATPDISPSPTSKPGNTYVPSDLNISVVAPGTGSITEPVSSQTPVVSPTVKPTVVPVMLPTPDPSVKPVETPDVIEEPPVTVEPSFSPDAGGNKEINKTNNLKKDSRVIDKKTKAVYKIAGTGKNKMVDYIKNTKKNSSSITIPNVVNLNGKTYKVVSIGNNAFKDNKKLKIVKIGRNVKLIGKNAFSGCTRLKNVTMSKNIETIGADAFNNCTALVKIIIPPKVAKIGARAFYQCKNLRYMVVKTKKLSAKNIGNNAFGKGSANIRVKTDKTKKKLYSKIFIARGMSEKVIYIAGSVKLVI